MFPTYNASCFLRPARFLKSLVLQVELDFTRNVMSILFVCNQTTFIYYGTYFAIAFATAFAFEDVKYFFIRHNFYILFFSKYDSQFQ